MQMLNLDTPTKTNRKNSKDEQTHRRNEVSGTFIDVTSEKSGIFGKSFSMQQVSHKFCYTSLPSHLVSHTFMKPIVEVL